MRMKLHSVGAWWRLFKTSADDRAVGAIRMLLLSVLVGICAGLGAIILVSALQFTSWLFLGKIGGVVLGGAANEPEPFHLPEIAPHMRRWAIVLLPALGGLLTGWFVKRFAPEAAGHGTDAAIEAYHFRGGHVRPVAVPVKALATSILIGTGGSAGCEGPITQIGAGFGSMISDALHLSIASRRKLMAAGMGAGVGALFHAPLAGALFAAEMLYQDLDLEYEVIVPAIVASVTSHTLFSRVFGFAPLFDTPQASFDHPLQLLLYIAFALVIAYGARFYTWFFYKVHELFNGLTRIPFQYRPVLGGLLTGFVGWYFLPALGSGYGTIQEALRFDGTFTLTSHAPLFFLLIGVFFLKTLTTAFSVGSGGSGGIFGPSLVVGGSLGGACGMVFATLFPSWDVSPGAFVLVGMVAFFGCAAKTPITTIIMIAEMTGNYRLLVPSMWVCILAYLLSRNVTLYRSQLKNRFEAPVHLSTVITSTFDALTVRRVLEARRGADRRFTTVAAGTTLSVLVDEIATGAQGAFPVVDDNGKLRGIITRTELASAENADPVFRQMMIVDDLTFAEHPIAHEDDKLRDVLARMDADDADSIIVVRDGKPVGVVSHNDIAAAYQAEIARKR